MLRVTVRDTYIAKITRRVFNFDFGPLTKMFRPTAFINPGVRVRESVVYAQMRKKRLLSISLSHSLSLFASNNKKKKNPSVLPRVFCV